MPQKHFLLVVYDIGNDRRRTKLHQLLLDYGTPVQYSVFECWLSDAEEARLKRAVRRIVRPKKQDHVRYYRLCARCVGETEVVGRYDAPGPAPSAWVVGDAEGG